MAGQQQVGFRLEVDTSQLDDAQRRIAEVQRQTQQPGAAGQPVAPTPSDMATALAGSAERQFDVLLRRLKQEMHPSDVAMQRYQDEVQAVAAQGTAVTPAQIRHLSHLRSRAAAAFEEYSGRAADAPESLVGGRMESGPHASMRMALPGGRGVTGGQVTPEVFEKYQRLLLAEIDAREKLLKKINADADSAVGGDSSQSGGGEGGGAGRFMAGAGKAGMLAAGLAAGAVAALAHLAGMFEILGAAVPKYGEHTAWQSRMSAMGVGGGGGAVGSGWGYGYTGETSMPFAEQWAAQSGGRAGSELFRMGRAYNVLPAVGQFGDVAYHTGERETHRLLALIARNVDVLGVPLGRMSEHLQEYSKAFGVAMATGLTPAGDWGDVVAGIESAMGGAYSGRVGSIVQRMQQGITNPQGEGQQALLYRAFGGLNGASYSEVMARMSGGLFGIEDDSDLTDKEKAGGRQSTAALLRKHGFLRSGIDVSGTSAINAVMEQIKKEFPTSGPDSGMLRMEAVKGLFPGMSDSAAIRIYEKMANNEEFSLRELEGIQEELKSEAQRQEDRANRMVSGIERVAVGQERAALALGEVLAPPLYALKEYAAIFMTNIVPPLLRGVIVPGLRMAATVTTPAKQSFIGAEHGFVMEEEEEYRNAVDEWRAGGRVGQAPIPPPWMSDPIRDRGPASPSWFQRKRKLSAIASAAASLPSVQTARTPKDWMDATAAAIHEPESSLENVATGDVSEHRDRLLAALQDVVSHNASRNTQREFSALSRLADVLARGGGVEKTNEILEKIERRLDPTGKPATQPDGN